MGEGGGRRGKKREEGERRTGGGTRGSNREKMGEMKGEEDKMGVKLREGVLYRWSTQCTSQCQ